ncbi:hypothetical protein BGZ83_000480 [Gryganskiella cystojenkinii]|nr:hypothetical protein BGZ83_000480 [Gryganskiella cystojenkinii]
MIENGRMIYDLLFFSFPPFVFVLVRTNETDVKYKRKYKDLKKRIRDIEDDNDVLNIKLSRARKNIHRLRVERRLDQTEHPVNNATVSSTSSSSSATSSDQDSDADQNGNRASRSHSRRNHNSNNRHSLDRHRNHSRYSSSSTHGSNHPTTSHTLAVPGFSSLHTRSTTPPSRASSVNMSSPLNADQASLSPSSNVNKKMIKKRRKDPLAPKRPSNAFFIFSQQHRQQAREEQKEGNQSELTKFLGQQWKSMPSTEKKIYSDLAIQDKQRYREEMSQYQHDHGINQNGGDSTTLSPKKKPGRPGRPPKALKLDLDVLSFRSNSEVPPAITTTTTTGHSPQQQQQQQQQHVSNKMEIHALVNDEDADDMSSHEEDYTLMSFEDEHEHGEEDEEDEEDEEEDDVDHHPGRGSSMLDMRSNGGMLGEEKDVDMTEFHHPVLPTVSVNGLLVKN